MEKASSPTNNTSISLKTTTFAMTSLPYTTTTRPLDTPADTRLKNLSPGITGGHIFKETSIDTLMDVNLANVLKFTETSRTTPFTPTLYLPNPGNTFQLTSSDHCPNLMDTMPYWLSS